MMNFNLIWRTNKPYPKEILKNRSNEVNTSCVISYIFVFCTYLAIQKDTTLLVSLNFTNTFNFKIFVLKGINTRGTNKIYHINHKLCVAVIKVIDFLIP